MTLVAALLLILAVGLGVRAARRERRRAALFRLGTFLGGDHDYDAATARGDDLGLPFTIRFSQAWALGDGVPGLSMAARCTEIVVELPRSYPLVLHVERRRWAALSSPPAPEFPCDQRLSVHAAPAEVLSGVVGLSQQAELLALGAVLLAYRETSAPRLHLILPGWALDVERVQEAARLLAVMAGAIESGFAELERDAHAQVVSRGTVGAPYRGHVDDSPVRAARALRATELHHARGALHEQFRRRAWRRGLGVLGIGVVAVASVAGIWELAGGALSSAAVVLILVSWLGASS